MNDALHPKPVPTRDSGPESDPSPPPQRVVVAVGLPGAGKSAWFARQGIVPLSSDQLRVLLADDENAQDFQTEIFAAMRALLRVRLQIGRPVTYLDATNLLRHFRRDFLEVAREHHCRVEALFFDVPLDVCLRRNAARRRRVPEAILRSMAEHLEPPGIEEGFQRIVVVGEDGQTLRELRA
jgi:predicted kinase